MNLTLFFRLIVMSIFQELTTRGSSRFVFRGEPTVEDMSYYNTRFFCPLIWAKDGFHMSVQINNANFCRSENGYRELGHTWETVEWGFPSHDDEILQELADGDSDNGMISISQLEELYAKHGGVDWEKTISVRAFDMFVKMDEIVEKDII